MSIGENAILKDDCSEQKTLQNVWTRYVYWLALCFAVFQNTVPVFFSFHFLDLQLKSLHIILGVSTALLAFSIKKDTQAGAKPTLWDWFLIGIILAANINVYVQSMTIYLNPEPTLKDSILGGVALLVLLEACRRSTGWAMPITVLIVFLYVFLGPIIPGDWGHPGFSFAYVMEQVYYSPNGMYGSITGYSATFIAVIIIFGSLLLFTGGGKTFIDLSLLIAGRFRGGPAKVGVVASAMFGMISGSPVANVAVCGTYTIPLMRRLGYDANFAGGVEAIASTGGTITPPIMGITAFVMAELINIPYIKVMFYALIPCILYYTGVMMGVHFEAMRLNLPPVPKEMTPHWKSVITWSRIVPFGAPLVILVWLLLAGYDLTFAGFCGNMAVIGFYFFSDLSLSGMKRRIIQIGEAMSDGGKSLASLVPIFVLVSILINLLGITGIAPKISMLILKLGGKFLIGALFVGAIIPLLLGTALPTLPSYLLSAALVAPALLHFKLDIMAVHMFLLYWAALSAVTPPTCVPCVIAANMGGGDWLKVAWVGMRLGMVAFLIPFFFILEPSLLGRGKPLDILVHFSSGMIGAILLSSSLFGYFRGKLSILIRVLYGAGGILLLFPGYYSLVVGLAISTLGFFGESLFMKLKGSDVRIPENEGK